MATANLSAVTGTGTLGVLEGRGKARTSIPAVTGTFQPTLPPIWAHAGPPGTNRDSEKAGDKLEKELLKVFKEKGPPPAAAKKMAEAYNKYAKTVMALPGRGTLTGAEVKLLEATLLQAIINPAGGLPTKFGQAWGKGVQQFWTAPPVLFRFGPYQGPVQMSMAQTIIPPLVVACLNTPKITEEQAAKKLAAALKLGTMSTMVMMVAPQLPPITATLK